MSVTVHPVATIGHSKLSIEAFILLLERHQITVVADVRSEPYSRFNPQFNRETLRDNLKAHNIQYEFLGNELGARSRDPSCYENRRVQFRRLEQTDLFRGGIEHIIYIANNYRIALMCAEKEPLECHRTILIARVLVERGVDVNHILADGCLESHDSTMERLLDVVGLPHQDLFRSKDELISEALDRQAQKVAYIDEKLATNMGREK
jgi:uncharacterized protein (DUF488 family)